MYITGNAVVGTNGVRDEEEYTHLKKQFTVDGQTLMLTQKEYDDLKRAKDADRERKYQERRAAEDEAHRKALETDIRITPVEEHARVKNIRTKLEQFQQEAAGLKRDLEQAAQQIRDLDEKAFDTEARADLGQADVKDAEKARRSVGQAKARHDEIEQAYRRKQAAIKILEEQLQEARDEATTLNEAEGYAIIRKHVAAARKATDAARQAHNELYKAQNALYSLIPSFGRNVERLHMGELVDGLLKFAPSSTYEEWLQRLEREGF